MPTRGDFLQRIVWRTPAVRMAFGSFRCAAAEGIFRHDADPVAGRLLGTGLAAAGLMSVLLDEKEKFSIRIDYDGPARGLLLESNADGRVRGLVKAPHVMEETPDLDTSCGKGAKVAVTRSCEGRVLNSGQSESAFILPDEALSYYLSTSDQLETELHVELLFQQEPKFPVRSAYGVLLQAMPDCDLEAFAVCRERLKSPEVRALLRDFVLPEAELRDKLISLLCAGMEDPQAECTECPPVRFSCGCSGKKIWETAAKMLGKEDLKKLLSENPDPVICCHFCNTEYHFRSFFPAGTLPE